MQERIDHPVLGKYDQHVFDDITDAGHITLASQGKYGWELPQDLPTIKLLSDIGGKSLLDLGCGWGNTIVIPAMEAHASSVFAVDVTPEHIGDDSPMARKAALIKYSNLHTILLPEDWWHHQLVRRPTMQGVLRACWGKLPVERSMDLVTARHVLQFSSPDAILNVLDLASLVLSPGGTLAAINFTPYTGYLYAYDGGRTLAAIILGNEEYRSGHTSMPAGYLSKDNKFGVSLANLLDKPAFQNTDFLCFDDATLDGIFRGWVKSRQARSLAVDLAIETSFYFSPPKIASHNKMTAPRYKGRENYYFALRKT